MRAVLVWELLPAGVFVTDEEFLLLSFPEVERRVEITWLVGVYCEWVWSQYRRRVGRIPVEEMVAALKVTYRRSVVSGVLLDMIPSLQ